MDYVSLGITRRTIATGQPKILTDDHRKTTVYVRGTTGTGKSRLIQGMIAQDICRGHSFCLVDPTGSIYNPTVQMLGRILVNLEVKSRTGDNQKDDSAKSFKEEFLKRFILLDFDQPDHGCRYNPLYINRGHGETAAQVAGDFLKAAERLLGSFQQQRRLKMILESACQLLAEAGGTLIDLPKLLKLNEQEIREFLQKLDNRAKEEGFFEIRSELARWYMEEFFAALKGNPRLDRIESTINLLGVWLNDPTVREFVNCTKGNIDFWEIINQGRILLCHVPLGANTDTTKVLGSFLVNKVQRQAYRRSQQERKKPFSLYADEFHLFVDQEFAVATATVRQFGLQLILAHQAADQPPLNTEEGQGVLNTIMANSGTKIFFKLGWQDAIKVADEVFLSGGQVVKRAYTEITENVQRSWGYTTSETISEALSEGISETSGTTTTDTVGNNITYTEGHGISKAVIHSLGLTITKGKEMSETISDSTGVTITQGKNETHIKTDSTASGTSDSEGHSFSTGNSKGTSITHNRGHGTSVSMNRGTSTSEQLGTFDPHDGRVASIEGTGETKTDNVSESIGQVESTFDQKGENYSNAISKVLSAAKGIAVGTTTTKGMEKSRTRGVTKSVSQSEALSRQISEGITEIQNFSKAMGESISKAVSMVHSTTRSFTKTATVSQSTSSTVGLAVGQTKKDVIEYYTMDEERVLNAQLLYTLPPRQAIVLTPYEKRLGDMDFGDAGELNAIEIKTHNIKGAYDYTFGDLDGVAEFKNNTKLKRIESPENSIFDSLGIRKKSGEDDDLDDELA